MKWLWIVLGAAVGIPLVLAVIGMVLPRDHVARMTLVLRAPPERVWALIADVAGTARWRPDVKSIVMQPPAAGGAVRFVEDSKQGKTPFEVVTQDAPRRQVVRVVDEGLPFGGTWTWELVPEGTGTRLTITETGFIRNPVFRVMSKLFFPPTASIAAYLRALSKELGETAEPR